MHLILPSNFRNNKDILTVSGAQITNTTLNLICKRYPPRRLFWKSIRKKWINLYLFGSHKFWEHALPTHHRTNIFTIRRKVSMTLVILTPCINNKKRFSSAGNLLSAISAVEYGRYTCSKWGSVFLIWLGVVMVRAWHSRSKGCGFDSQPCHCHVSTLNKVVHARAYVVRQRNVNQSINQSVIVSVPKIAEAITKSTVAQLGDDARKWLLKQKCLEKMTKSWNRRWWLDVVRQSVPDDGSCNRKRSTADSWQTVRRDKQLKCGWRPQTATTRQDRNRNELVEIRRRHTVQYTLCHERQSEVHSFQKTQSVKYRKGVGQMTLMLCG